MATINPLAVDLSHYDPAKDYSAVKASGIVGAIYKASDGTTYNDPTYKSQKSLAKAVGLKWGSYHFAHPGNVQAQADNYLRFSAPEPDEIFCLDWESTNNGTMSSAEARAWITIVENALQRPRQCLLYSGNVAKEQLNGKNDFFSQRRLWLAQYSTTPSVQVSWTTFWLWQFTDGQVGPMPHSIPGVGPCDINSYSGMASQLAAEWATGTAVSPAPQPQELVVNITVEAPPGIKVNVRTTNG